LPYFVGRAAVRLRRHRHVHHASIPILLIVAILVPAESGKAQAVDRATRTALDSIVDAEIARREPFAGLEVAIARGGQTAYRRTYGMADLEHGVPMPSNAMFQIASLTKQFTAAAVLRLVEQGRLRLDDDVRDYLPDVDNEGHVVRVRTLLNHTSGIPNLYDLEAWPEIRPLRLDRAGTRPLVAAAAQAHGLDFAPDTGWRYSNSGYDLLGDLIEAVSGVDYETYLRRTLFEPLEMADTSFCPWSRIVQRRARGYEPDGDSLVNAFRVSQGVLFASGGLCSTVDDLLRWNEALHGGRVLRPESYRRMTTPEGGSRRYGFGLYSSELGGHPVYRHNGYINGYSAQLEYFPEDELSVVVLTNTPAAVAGMAEDLARVVLGLRPRPVARRPDRWVVAPVPAEADTTGLDFRSMGPGVHVTAGPS
jgi:CubicO group peptidase (beta-lactamase class C family)